MERDRQSILAAIDTMRELACKEQNWEIAEFACSLANCEMIKADIIYPTVILIGDYLQQVAFRRRFQTGTDTRRTKVRALFTIGNLIPTFGVHRR